MLRGSLSAAPASEVWVEGQCLFVQNSRPLLWWAAFWKYRTWTPWTVPEQVRNWLWSTAQHVKVVAVWYGESPEVDSGLVAEHRVFSGPQEALNAVKASPQVVELLVEDSSHVVSTVSRVWNVGTLYRR